VNPGKGTLMGDPNGLFGQRQYACISDLHGGIASAGPATGFPVGPVPVRGAKGAWHKAALPICTGEGPVCCLRRVSLKGMCLPFELGGAGVWSATGFPVGPVPVLGTKVPGR
jgi:hypothetical protein